MPHLDGIGVLEKLNIVESNAKVMPDAYMLATDEEKIAFLRGLFLATGSVSNPQTSGYHMEMSVTIFLKMMRAMAYVSGKLILKILITR